MSPCWCYLWFALLFRRPLGNYMRASFVVAAERAHRRGFVYAILPTTSIKRPPTTAVSRAWSCYWAPRSAHWCRMRAGRCGCGRRLP